VGLASGSLRLSLRPTFPGVNFLIESTLVDLEPLVHEGSLRTYIHEAQPEDCICRLDLTLGLELINLMCSDQSGTGMGLVLWSTGSSLKPEFHGSWPGTGVYLEPGSMAASPALMSYLEGPGALDW
jgi:hypothetical protein